MRAAGAPLRAGGTFLRGLERRIRLEWLSTTLILCALTLGLGLSGPVPGLARLDRLLYDTGLLAVANAPPIDDILIIAIDDASLEEIGQWPWRRSVHAGLLDRLQAARAVGMDLVFNEHDATHPLDVDLLAHAIAGHGKVVLPTVVSRGMSLGPLPQLAEAAHGVGYINIPPDQDGLVRSLVPTWQLGNDQVTHHFIIPMLRTAGAGEQADALEQIPPGHKLHIPFVGSAGHFNMVPYARVLDGSLPPEAFRDRIVLIGSWGTGLGDSFPTPRSHEGPPMSGVEILANALQAGLQDSWIRTATPLQQGVASVLPVLLLCGLIRRLTPTRALLATVLVFAGLLYAHYLCLRHGLWVTPTAGLIGAGLAYPLWSWRTQVAVLRQMDVELAKLQAEEDLLSQTDSRPEAGDASLPGRVMRLHGAIERVRDLRRFLADTLEATPDPTFVFDMSGRLRFASGAGLSYLHRLGRPALARGQTAEEFLEPVVVDAGAREALCRHLQGAAPGESDTVAVYDGLKQAGLEQRDALGHDLLIKALPIETARGKRVATIMTLTDITPIRLAERRREETLRFLSHDMRSPQTSILALIDLQRDPARSIPQKEFLARVSGYSARTLELVDGFVQLARAESLPMQTRPVDLVDLLLEICDEHWALAQARELRIRVDHPQGQAWVLADRALLRRALGNLVNNAIKYSAGPGEVVCRLRPRGARWCIDVQDEGRGMDTGQIEQAFQPFVRLHEGDGERATGSGLGLAVVQAIIQRHDGTVSVESTVGHGSVFTITLPAHAPAAAA